MHITFYEYPSEKQLLFLETEKDHDFTHIPRKDETIFLQIDKDTSITGVIEMVHWESAGGILVAVGLYIRPIKPSKVKKHETP